MFSFPLIFFPYFNFLVFSFFFFFFFFFFFQPVLAALGITVANLNKGRPIFYYMVLLAFSLLFDFIQMCISNGVGLNISSSYTGAHIFALILMIFNFLIKIIIIFCGNKLFGQLGGTWAFSASFGLSNAGGTDGDSAYANMTADGTNGASVDYNVGSGGGYQDHDYKSPPPAQVPSGTQNL